jgi:predicted nucleic acid-binding Zn finger protein
MVMVKFRKQGLFFNPLHASLMEITSQESFPGQCEIFMGKQPTVAIVTGYCTDSNLLLALSTKYCKSVMVLFHGQEWEQYCCFTNMIFDQKQMVAQLYQSAISFSTLLGGISAPPTFQSANISPLSGCHAKTNDTPVERA